MNDFWDKKYVKIAYHGVLFVALSYIAINIIDFFVFSVTDLGTVTSGIGSFIGFIAKLFMPFIIAVIFAFLFDPLVTKFQDIYENIRYERLGFKNKKKNVLVLDGEELRQRAVGSLVTIVAFYGLIILIIRSFVLIIINSAKTVAGPTTLSEQSITNYFNSAIAFLDGKIEIIQDKLVDVGLGQYAERIVTFFYTLIEGLINIISDVALNLGSLVMSISSSVIMVFVATIMAFHIMKNKEQMIYKGKKFAKLFLPNNAHKVFSGLFIDVITVFSGYVRGMLVDVTIIAMLVSGALWIIGVPYAMIIGIISGFANFIPYLGSFTAAVLAILSAALTGDITKVIAATIAVIIIQQIDSLIVVPKALGNSVEISPLLVILSLSVAGTMFGLVGMIVAVPLTALIKIFIERLIINEEEYHSVQNFYKKFHKKKEN